MIRRESPTSQQETQMASQSLRDLQSDAVSDDPMHRLRLLCLSRGADGILALGRAFRKIDHDGRKQLTEHEFIQGLTDTGLGLSHEESLDLFNMFRDDHTGRVNMDEFLIHIMPTMCKSRKQVVDKAFEKIDKNADGVISIQDLKNVYNVDSQPRYISGEESQEAILKRFLAHFEREASKHGVVTHEEFFNYYSAVSATIDNDCYFDLMMRQGYKL